MSPSVRWDCPARKEGGNSLGRRGAEALARVFCQPWGRRNRAGGRGRVRPALPCLAQPCPALPCPPLSSPPVPAAPSSLYSLPQGLGGHGARARGSARPAGRLLCTNGGSQAFGADLGSRVSADGERRGGGGGRMDAGAAARRRVPRPPQLPRPWPRRPASLRPVCPPARAGDPRTQLPSGETALSRGRARRLRRGRLPRVLLGVLRLLPRRKGRAGSSSRALGAPH